MKTLKVFTLALTLPLALPAFASAQSVTVVVNDQPMTFAQPPIVRTGRVFVPLRGVFERLGASVVYSNGQINATGHGREISLTIGSTQATVGGNPETIDVAPFIVAETTFVPLRFVSQALGASVNWNDSTSTVTIISLVAPGAAQPGNAPRPISLVGVSPTGTTYNPSPTLRFQFNRSVRLADFRITVDGRSVTSGVRQDGAFFAVDLPWRLISGPHRVRVAGTTASGADFDLWWSFVRE
ncbi:MAG: copper amine oxidase N-terminal domain-containing protein [Candidatus Cybelea sp.]